MKLSTSSLVVLGLLVSAPAVHAATTAPAIAPVLPQSCLATVVIADITLTEFEFTPQPDEGIQDALRRQLQSSGLAPDDPIFRITCAEPAGTRRVHFGVQIDSVTTTPLIGATEGSEMPPLPDVGSTATGTLVYDSSVNSIVTTVMDDPAAEGLTYEEIDALLPGALHPLAYIRLEDSAGNVFGNRYSTERGAMRTFAVGNGGEVTLPDFYEVAIGNNAPDSGDVFATAALRFSPYSVGGSILDIFSNINDAVNWASRRCAEEGLLGYGQEVLNVFSNIPTSVIGSGVTINVQDSRPSAENAALFSGDLRDFDRTVYPILARSPTNEVQWTFYQLGTSPATWDRVPIPTSADNCQSAIEQVAEIFDLIPGDLTPYIAPVRMVEVEGRVSYLSPTAALTPPPTVIPLPGGFLHLLAGLGAFGVLRARTQKGSAD